MTTFPLPPGSTIGILGGGQLGRMLALAAARLGLDVAILTPDLDSPASRVVKTTIIGAYDDAQALKALADASDVVTYEFENVPAAAVEQLAKLGMPVAPDPRALAVAQDRVEEKSFLNGAGAPTVAFAAADTAAMVETGLSTVGAPALLKTRRGGYDGKGQTWIEQASDAAAAFERIGSVAAILEARADFVRELSVIAARGRDGEIAIYPLAENHHEDGVLRRTHAPAPVSTAILEQAERIAAQIMTALDYVGVIGIELFLLKDDRLVVNEIAPRVHNTGHWTMDGCAVDQFEQHIRAVAGWPLGSTQATSGVEMLNLLGEEANGWAKYASEADTRIHLYGKRDAVPGRKMGHVNRLRAL